MVSCAGWLLTFAIWLWLPKAHAQLLTAPPPAGAAAGPSDYCPAPAAICGQDGLCTDLQTDADNCGACGNSCGGKACVAGKCATPTEGGGFALGINLGGVWGQGDISVDDDTLAPTKYEYAPFGTHFLFSGQMGYRGKYASIGARLGFSKASNTGSEVSPFFRAAYGPDAKIDQLFVRFGGFLDFNVYKLKVKWVDLVTYIEAAIYLDASRVDVSSSTTSTDNGFSGTGFTPALGTGFDFGLIGGLRAGLYGGLNIFVSSGGEFDESDETYSGAFAGGEFRMNLMYAFGSKRPAPNAPPKPVYALLLEEFEQEGAQGREAYAFGTPRYESSYANYRKVAVAAPSSCENRSTSGDLRAGDAGGRTSNEVLATACGVEMAMLERVLAERGYTVTSWRSIAQTAQGRSSVEVARSFGAEVLFQVNSLERTARPAGDAQTRYTWLKSDAWGNHGPELQSSLTLSPSDIQQLNDAALQRQRAADGAEYPGAMADINAIDVATGETIWLYRWERAVDSASTDNSALLMKGTPTTADAAGLRRWSIETPIRPREVAAQPAAPSLLTASSQRGGARTGRSAQDQLLEEIVQDFVGTFQTGQGRQAQPQPQPQPQAAPTAPSTP